MMTDIPLGKYFTKLHQSGRMLNWGVEMSEFDIRYVPRSSMKGQVIADFVVECTIPQPKENLLQDEGEMRPWILHVDGASNRQGGWSRDSSGITRRTSHRIGPQIWV